STLTHPGRKKLHHKPLRAPRRSTLRTSAWAGACSLSHHRSLTWSIGEKDGVFDRTNRSLVMSSTLAFLDKNHCSPDRGAGSTSMSRMTYGLLPSHSTQRPDVTSMAQSHPPAGPPLRDT